MPKTKSSLLIEATALVPWLAVAARVALGVLAEGRMDVAGRCLCKSTEKTGVKNEKTNINLLNIFSYRRQRRGIGSGGLIVKKVSQRGLAY